ncbi:MAG TPA: PQQ-binding-like beta-propeller repeat protein [Bacillota bacterium]|nr:PQQ-binding-like beta-propeller repeat protein [Bacillota bacterium]
MKKALAITAAGILTLTISAFGDDWPQWRGPQRDGISKETGLLKEWPKEGPKLLWQVKETGSGYSTPSVVGDRLYLLGNEGVENEFAEALALQDGKRVWQTRLGKVGNPNQQPKFPAARSTPTVDGKLLYALGSDGDLACLELASGKEVWRKSLRTDFGGKPGTWAYSESPLVDGDLVICTPGGSEATLVALNKKTGEVVWKSAVPGGDEAAYTSAIIVEAGGVKQYVQMLQKGLVGLDAKTGKFLWRYNKTVSKYNANIPTPVARDGYVFSAGAGTGAGLVKLTEKDGAFTAEQVYFSPKLPVAIGGAVLVDDNLYGTGNAGLMCVEFTTGNVKWDDKALGAASLCFADGRLYLHGENGEVALVVATPAGYQEKGRFTPPNQPSRSNPMEKAWAYPVVANGRLYLRDHDMLWCYDVKEGR